MKAWVITNKDAGSLLLWRHTGGYFQVIEGDSYLPLINHANYILLQQRFASVFSRLAGQVAITAAKLKDAQLHIEHNDYIELTITHRLPHIDNHTTLSETIEIWTYGSYLFVSNSIKEELERIDSKAFTFSPGFGRFKPQ